MGVIFRGDVGFWGKNGAWRVNLQGLGKIGKKKTFENVRKYSKIFNELMVNGKWLNGEW